MTRHHSPFALQFGVALWWHCDGRGKEISVPSFFFLGLLNSHAFFVPVANGEFSVSPHFGEELGNTMKLAIHLRSLHS